MRQLFKLRFTIGVLIICFTLVASAAVWTAKERRKINASQISTPKIENKTRSLIIESVTEVNDVKTEPQNKWRRFKVIVRNSYSRSIVAYSFRQQDNSVGKGTIAGLEINGATNGWVLPPNRTDTVYLSASSEGEIVITLSAVLLEDTTGDGDIQTLSRLKDVRAGVKLAYQQIIPLIRQATNSDEEAKPNTIVQSLTNEISSTLDEKTVPPNLRRGFYDGKNFIINNLRELDNKFHSQQNLQYRSEIAKILTQIEELLAKL